jgi:hypothetical protein
MKSAKQRGAEIKSAREQRKAARLRAAIKPEPALRPLMTVPVNEKLLAPNHSYGAADFVMRGFYFDRSFCCKDCGKNEIRTATQQNWWYEVAKVLPGPPPFVVAPAGARNRSDAVRPGEFTWKSCSQEGAMRLSMARNSQLTELFVAAWLGWRCHA